MKVYITKDEDGHVKCFYGKKPKLNTNGIHGAFWEIPLSEWDDTCGYDYISQSGAYYYSIVLLKMFTGIDKIIDYTDEPLEYEIEVFKSNINVDKEQ